MIGFRHTATDGLRETVFRVYASKRRAEVAPGVGTETDMAIITDAGLSWLDDEMFKQLAHIY